MKEKINQAFDYIKNNIIQTILISILITTLSPFLFTRKINFIDFTETGQIGDTIGGITAPFINILNAILIYIAFTEQLKANNLLQNQIESEKDKEEVRLDDLRKLILFDLQYKILPSLNGIELEIPVFLRNRELNISSTYNNFVEFNDVIYKNIDPRDLLKIFDADLKKIIEIYNRVNFISSMIPVNISKKYPIDRNTLKLIHLTDEEYNRLKDRHEEKIRMELTSLLNQPIKKCKSDIYSILMLFTNEFINEHTPDVGIY